MWWTSNCNVITSVMIWLNLHITVMICTCKSDAVKVHVYRDTECYSFARRIAGRCDYSVRICLPQIFLFTSLVGFRTTCSQFLLFVTLVHAPHCVPYYSFRPLVCLQYVRSSCCLLKCSVRSFVYSRNAWSGLSFVLQFAHYSSCWHVHVWIYALGLTF
jgi:hypothetical protein